ncbi:MAG: acetyltransferase [Latescibacteria bacterium DG_63]|nr:MAG: acetyltransferase [Latescibacteria bacterium DG_63]
MSEYQTRAIQKADKEWVAGVMKKHWGSTLMVSRGRVCCADELPGFIAVRNAERIGVVTYQIVGEQCEIVTLNSLVEGIGVASALINCVRQAAVKAGCTRLWLITTNDNLAALRFYQKRGFFLVAVHVNALDESRRLKPEIPEFGIDGIPLRDEIELEMGL